MKSFKSSYAAFYDLLYRDKNYKKEFDNINKFIPKKILFLIKFLS